MGLSKTDAGTAVTITLVLLSALLTGLDLYEKLAKHAGAGTLVPVTGFANSVVAPAMEFKSEGFVAGAALFLVQIFSIMAARTLFFARGSNRKVRKHVGHPPCPGTAPVNAAGLAAGTAERSRRAGRQGQETRNCVKRTAPIG